MDQFFNAVNNGNIQEVATLVNAGVDIESRDQHGYTALMIASKRGYINIVDFLLSRGADVDALSDNTNDDIPTNALMIAASNDHIDVVQLLIGAGANINIGVGNYEAANALNYAISSNNPGLANMVRFLISRGADIDYKNQDGSPIEIASWNQNVEVVGILLDAGVDLVTPIDEDEEKNIVDYIVSGSQYTPNTQEKNQIMDMILYRQRLQRSKRKREDDVYTSGRNVRGRYQ